MITARSEAETQQVSGKILQQYIGNERDVVITKGVRGIASAVFAERGDLFSLRLPDGLETIGKRCFENCSNLRIVHMSDSITDIGEYAFAGCVCLRTVNLPERLQTVAAYLFKDCHSIRSITIPPEVTSIGVGAFSGCSSLVSIHIPGSVTSFSSVFDQTPFSGCNNLTIYTPAGSAAEEFARFHGIPFVNYHSDNPPLHKESEHRKEPAREIYKPSPSPRSAERPNIGSAHSVGLKFNDKGIKLPEMEEGPVAEPAHTTPAPLKKEEPAAKPASPAPLPPKKEETAVKPASPAPLPPKKEETAAKPARPASPTPAPPKKEEPAAKPASPAPLQPGNEGIVTGDPLPAKAAAEDISEDRSEAEAHEETKAGREKKKSSAAKKIGIVAAALILVFAGICGGVALNSRAEKKAKAQQEAAQSEDVVGIDYTLTLEDFVNNNDTAKQQIKDSVSGTNVSVDVKENTLIYTYDLSTSEEITEETAGSDDVKDALEESLDSSESRFTELCEGLETDTGISGITVEVRYVYKDTVLVSRQFGADLQENKEPK